MFTITRGVRGRHNHTPTLDLNCIYLCQMYSPSQLASAGAQTLADKLTEPLRMAGDLEYATPGSMYAPLFFFSCITFIGMLNFRSGFGVDQDEDDFMNSAHQSQFTQSLMLFVSCFISIPYRISTDTTTHSPKPNLAGATLLN